MPSESNETSPNLISTRHVAVRLNCSTRHVRRLVDRGAMPQPLRLGALIRFDADAIEQWIREGCPDCRGTKP